MAYDPPSESELRTLALDAYRAKFPGADVSPSSEIYARSSLVAGAAALVAHGVRSVEDQIFPDTADTANVERHAGMYDMARKQPTTASGGTLSLFGTTGTPVSSGLTAFHADGTEFVTTSSGTVNASGFLLVGLDAVTPGSAGNRIVGDDLQLSSPPAFIDATATVAADLDGGTDEESNDDLAARVLQRMQRGNAGGTDVDYEQWALSVDGVTEAHCLATRLGPGTVSVAVFTLGGSGFRAPAGATLLTDVETYIETVRPVTAEVDAPAVTETAVDVTVDDLDVEPGFDPDEVKANVEDAIEAHIYDRRTNELMYRTQLGRSISAVAGVRDYTLTDPSSSTVAPGTASEAKILAPGTITVNLLP